MPQEIDYPENVPNEHCAKCHKEVNTALEQDSTKHRNLRCAYCHAVHEQIPECKDCHIIPHDSINH